MALAGPLPRSSAVSTALSEFQASLTNERKAHLLANCSVPCALEVLTFTAELDRANAARKRRGVASRFCTILESIQQYSAVMDTYSQVQADTTSLIWGSLKLCIHIASSAASYYDKLSEWFMRLGKICPRYSEWQCLFPHDSRLRKALDVFYATVIRFCTKAIQVLDRSGIMNFVSTLWKPFELEFAALEKDLKQQRAEIDDEIRLATAQVALQEREAASRFREGFSRNLIMWRSADETRNRTVDRAKTVSAKQCLLERLSSYNYKAALKENRKKRHGSSCSWLAEQPIYRQWLADPQSSVFWLSGGVGCGKSVLCAATIDDLLRNHVQSSHVISFFFCRDNDAESVSAAAILRSLVRQCLTAETVSEALQAQISEALADGAPEPSELAELFTTVSHMSQTHFVVVDGLDECPMDTQRALLDVLGGVPKPSQSWRLKLFVTCRDDVGTHDLSPFPSLYPLAVSRKHVDADIATYVEETLRSKIARAELFVGCPELVEDVRRALVKGADGMFLWVFFQIQDICEQTCDKDIRRVITKLPKGLEETYQRILHRIGQRGKAGVAARVFCWAYAVRRPLTLEELHEAIAVEAGQTSFQRDLLLNGFEHVGLWCGNLVTVEEESRAVQFAHSSVKQYLCSRTKWSYFCPADADMQVGQACVTYLCFTDFERQLVKASKLDLSLDPAAVASTSLSASCDPIVTKGLKLLGRMRKNSRAVKLDALARLLETQRSRAAQHQFAFLTYACEYWIAHTSDFSERTPEWRHLWRLVADDTHFASLSCRLQSSGDEKQLVHYIIEYHHKALLAGLRDWRPQLLAGHIDALFQMTLCRGLSDLTMIILDVVKAGTGPLDHWLHIAAAAGQATIARRLVTLGANVDARYEDATTALQVAAQNGHFDVIQVLLAAGADINVHAMGEGGLVLLRAASRVDDLDLIELLINAGAKFDTPLARSDGQRAIRAAAEMGRLPLAKKLVYAGACATGNETWSTGWTLFQAAVEAGEMELVDRLLSAGANINAKAADDRGRTALQAATSSGNLKMVQRLLNAGADVNAGPAENGGRTALQAAASSGNFDMLRLLLEAGADVNAEPAAAYGRTALQAAAEAGHLEIALALLRAGADVNARPAQHGATTALGAAARAGNMELMEKLIDAGAAITGNEVWQQGWTLLQAAAQSGLAHLVDRLLRAGADVNARAGHTDGRTALQAAAGAGHLDIVERLLVAGADVNAKPAKIRGRTALQAALEASHGPVADHLIRAGADVDALPAYRSGKTALQAAAETGNMTAVRALVKGGASSTGKETWVQGWTLLQAAAGAGHMDVVEHLLDSGADVNAKPARYRGRTALQAAAVAGHLDVVERLLRAGAAVNARGAGFGGRTALQAAVEAHHWEVVGRLLDAGADFSAGAADDSGSALFAAAEAGQLTILKRLLSVDGRHGRTAVQAAADAGNMVVAEALVNAGAAATGNELWLSGWTFLQEAARIGCLALVRRLVAAGADVNASAAAAAGRIALQAAAEWGHVEIVTYLLGAGADVNAGPSLTGRTALQAAAGAGCLAMVERLLAAGAHVNAEPAPDGGRTALQAAARAGDLEVAECLLRAGADVYARPAASGGETALQAAHGADDPAMVETLARAGAGTAGKRQPKRAMRN